MNEAHSFRPDLGHSSNIISTKTTTITTTVPVTNERARNHRFCLPKTNQSPLKAHSLIERRKRGTAKTADLVAFLLLHLAVGARTTTATTVLYCTVAAFSDSLGSFSLGH